jgi:hypothetical protein
MISSPPNPLRTPRNVASEGFRIFSGFRVANRFLSGISLVSRRKTTRRARELQPAF